MTAATDHLKRADDQVRSATSSSDLRAAVKTASVAVAAVRRSGDRKKVRELERKLGDLVKAADERADALDREHSRIAWQANMLSAIGRLAPQNLGISDTLATRAEAALDDPPPPSTGNPAEVKAVGERLKTAKIAVGMCTAQVDVDRLIHDAQRNVEQAPAGLTQSQRQSLNDRLRDVRKAAEKQQAAIELLGRGASHHLDYSNVAGSDRPEGELGEVLLETWTSKYQDEWAGRELVTVTDDNGFVYLFDATTDDTVPPRMLGVFGKVQPPAGPRNNSRIAGFPKQSRDAKERFDRGHMIAHELGGSDEGHNLVGQAADVNRGGLWRAIERDLKDQPGTLMFVRTVYDESDDRPVAFEHGQITADGTLDIAYFHNS